MNRDPQDGPFKQAKLLTEHIKEPCLTILLVNTTSSATDVKITPEENSLEIIRYQRSINGMLCQIIDLPTLCTLLGASTLDPVHIEELRAQMSTIRYIWFATRLDETTLSINEQNIIKWLSIILGEQIWSDALLAVIHARTTTPWKCASMMKKRSEIVRAGIARYCGWDIARSIIAVPVGHPDELLLDDRGLWPAQSSNPHSGRTVPWQESYTKATGEFPRHLNTLTLCYLWSGPAGALGLCLWGPLGFGIGLAGNALFWTVIGWLQNAREA